MLNTSASENERKRTEQTANLFAPLSRVFFSFCVLIGTEQTVELHKYLLKAFFFPAAKFKNGRYATKLQFCERQCKF